MLMTLSSTPQESSVSERYGFRGVQYNITVTTSKQHVPVSVCDKLMGDCWSFSFHSYYRFNKASKVAGNAFTECVLMS